MIFVIKTKQTIQLVYQSIWHQQQKKKNRGILSIEDLCIDAKSNTDMHQYGQNHYLLVFPSRKPQIRGTGGILNLHRLLTDPKHGKKYFRKPGSLV